MWTFFSFGLIMPSLRPAETVADGDTRDIQIRGRRHRDVKFFVEHYMPKGSCSVDMPPAGSEGAGGSIGEADPYIWDTPQLDYNCRTYCTKADLAIGMANATLAEIDYVKFKPSTARHADNGVYHGVLNATWGNVTLMGPAGGVWADPGYKGYSNPRPIGKSGRSTAPWRNAWRNVDNGGLPASDRELAEDHADYFDSDEELFAGSHSTYLPPIAAPVRNRSRKDRKRANS